MNKRPTIFVSIACFMDPDLLHTINDLYSKAKYPDRIFVGVCLQHDPDSDQFVTVDRFRQVRVDAIPYTEAKGPIYARARCEALIEDEDYFFQVDCHSRFFQAWDEILIEQFKRCQDSTGKAVISHYPININNMCDEEKCSLIGKINRFRYVGSDDIKMHGSLVQMPEQPVQAFGITAAMLFMDCRQRQSLPLDPNLDFGLHAAEQFLYSARLWTHGFDVMTPTQHTVATEYMTTKDRLPEKVRQSYNSRSRGWKEKTWSKVKYYLQIDDLDQVDEYYRDEVLSSQSKYGMGQVRALYDYYRFTGLHPALLDYFPFYARHQGNDPLSGARDSSSVI